MSSAPFNRSNYHYRANITWLYKYDFDKIDMYGYLQDGHRYRIKRDTENLYDSNAVAVYVSELKVGYLESGLASTIAPLLDSGHIFSFVHEYSKKSENYSKKYDDERGDGYYRKLTITIFDETSIHKAQGKEIDPILKERLVKTPDPIPGSGCGCLMLLIGGLSMLSFCIILII